MANVDVYDWNKKKVGSVELNPEVFENSVRKDVLHTVVRWQLAKKRQGTHKAKTRGEVSGGGKKPYKQKGTGNARQGSTRSPLLAGGGVIFGPSPRNYQHDLPKKVRQVGLKSALSYLQQEGRLFVIDNMATESGKTKDAALMIKNFGEKAVLVGKEFNDQLKRATQNLQNVRYYPVTGLNVYDLLKFDRALIAKDSLEAIEKKCGVEK